MNINEQKAQQFISIAAQLTEVAGFIEGLKSSVTDEGLQVWFGGLPSDIAQMQSQLIFQANSLTEKAGVPTS